MTDVFLSYTREDQKAAKRIVDGLRSAGLGVWWDSDIPVGAPWEATIERELAAAKTLLVCWSPAAVESENVRSEARWARERGKLLQVFVGRCEPPLFFGERQGIDLSRWNGRADEAAFRQVVEGIQTAIGTATTQQAHTARQHLRRRRSIMVPIAAAAIFAAGGLLWSAHVIIRNGATGTSNGIRIEASRLDVLDIGDNDLGKFARGLRAAIIDQLNENRINVVTSGTEGSPKDQGEADYSVGGTVERDADKILVHMQLIDRRNRLAIWTGSYADLSSRSSVLQDEVAAEAAAVGSEAADARRLRNVDPEALGLLIKSVLYSRRNLDKDREAEWENAKLLRDKLPGQSFTHSSLAIVSAFLAYRSTPDRAAELRALATSEAAAASRINPRDSLAFFARDLLLPAVGHWRERQAWVESGLKVNPDSALLNTQQSNLLREVGRLNDAVAFARRAAAPQPPSPNRNATLMVALSEAAQFGEAASLADKSAKTWPTHAALWQARLRTLIEMHRWTQASQLFAPNGYRPDTVSDDASAAWQAALGAMSSDSPSRKQHAASLLTALLKVSTETSRPANEIAMLFMLGDKADGLAEARAYLQSGGLADSSFLFWPSLADFRRDPQFWQLASTIGLVDYWRGTNALPDACSEPALEQRCKAIKRSFGS